MEYEAELHGLIDAVLAGDLSVGDFESRFMEVYAAIPEGAAIDDTTLAYFSDVNDEVNHVATSRAEVREVQKFGRVSPAEFLKWLRTQRDARGIWT